MDAKRVMITGGAGFIGANLVRWIRRHRPQWEITVVDRLTYAGNRRYIEEFLDRDRLLFVVADIADREAMEGLFSRYSYDGVFHLAAESHVDRSIDGPAAFVHTNLVGTFTLLECARRTFKSPAQRFLHVSTDEVYGSLGPEGLFSEKSPYDPSSPYSATKAGSDHLVRAYHRTYGLNTVITNCSNNFGPYQYPEKLIPLVIRSLRDFQPVPVYGDGQNIRDWLYVADHCRGLVAVFEGGAAGECYPIGGRNEWRNIDLVELICDRVDHHLGRPAGTSRRYLEFVRDRPGHDRRYAIDPSRMEGELGWQPRVLFEEALDHTVQWYLEHMTGLWAL